jgi:hypothetical protein
MVNSPIWQSGNWCDGRHAGCNNPLRCIVDDLIADSYSHRDEPTFKQSNQMPRMTRDSDPGHNLEDDGFMVVERAITERTCAKLLKYMVASFHKKQTDYIIKPKYRVHCPLELTKLVEKTLVTVVSKRYGELDRFLNGSQDLVELSSITVFPYAKEQGIHPDEQNAGKRLISVFVNLAPTSFESGALRIIPGTHKDLDTDFSDHAAQPLELPIGSAVFMDSKTWHGGCANQTLDRIRPVFYFSFGEPRMDSPTYSILSGVEKLGKTLANFADQP